MKTILLSACLLLISTLLSAQYSRSLYPTSEAGVPRSASIADLNGENYFISIKESDDDTIRILTGRIDALGETDTYRESLITGLPFYYLAVSGMAGDNSGNLNCAVITNDFSLGYLHYLRIDPLNGTSTIAFTLPFDLEGPFAPTRVKGDSLVTYITQEAVGLIRIAASIDDPSNFSYELVDASISVGGTLSGGARHIEFKVDGSGTEYVCADGYLYKRTATNIYQNSTLSNFPLQEYAGITLAVNAANEVLVINPSKYELFNSSLTSIGLGLNNFDVDSGSRFFELRSDAGFWKFYVQNSEQIMEEITFNNTLTITSRSEISQKSSPHSILSVGGIPYLISARKVSTLGTDFGLSCVGISQINASPIVPFIEFNQQMEHDLLNFSVGHVGAEFLNDGKRGIQYTHNGQEKSILYTGASYVVGKNQNGVVYSSSTNSDTMPNIPGPYCPTSMGNIELIDRYSRGYYVNRNMIDEHITMITNGNPSYVIPFGIREWPAHGNTAIGQAENLAPFEDQNSNGVYEPELGDYPSIYGTQCVLNMYHGNPLFCEPGLEYHQYIYTLDCDTSETLNSTVFVTNRIFARSGDFTEAYMAQFSDGDLGNALDDYHGTNVELGMTYFYNGDLNDEPSNGQLGFNDTLPALGYQILKGIKIANDGQDNDGTSGFSVNAYGLSDGTTDNEFSTLESSLQYIPDTSFTTPALFYNILQGIYPDGAPNSVNGVDIRFDYFGESDPNFYASGGIDHGNMNYEFIPPGDRAIWASSGQFNLDPSNVIEITSAYITAIDTNMAANSLQQPLNRLFSLGTILKDMYGNNAAGCELSFNPYVSDLTLSLGESEILPEFSIYPNPTKGELHVRTDASGPCNWQLIDMQGKVLKIGELNSQTIISLADLSSGLYLFSIQTASHTLSKRVVKN